MKVQFEDDGKHGKFFVSKDGKELAQMTFTWAGPDKFMIDHTEVDDSLRGQGVGKQMLMHAVEYARTNNHKILPLCTFAKSVLNKNEDLQDVL